MPLIRVNTEFSGLGGTPWFSTFHFLGDADGAHATDAIAATDNFWGGVSSGISPSVTWVISGDVEIVNIATGETTGVLAQSGEAGVGLGTGEPLPLATQCLVRWRTGIWIGGRELRGKTFLPGQLVANTNAAGAPDTAYTAGIEGVAGGLLSDSAGFAVYSKTHNTASTVESTSCWAKWAVLRSRRD